MTCWLATQTVTLQSITTVRAHCQICFSKSIHSRLHFKYYAITGQEGKGEREGEEENEYKVNNVCCFDLLCIPQLARPAPEKMRLKEIEEEEEEEEKVYFPPAVASFPFFLVVF